MDILNEKLSITKKVNKLYQNKKYQEIILIKDDILRFDYVTSNDLKIALSDFLKHSKNYFNEIIFYTYKYKNSYNLAQILEQ